MRNQNGLCVIGRLRQGGGVKSSPRVQRRTTDTFGRRAKIETAGNDCRRFLHVFLRAENFSGPGAGSAWEGGDFQ